MSTTLLLVLDGYGETENTVGNAILKANTETIDYLKKNYPYQLGYASGMDVGLPDGQMGNSEVGHLNLGAGRIVYQELTRITKSIQDGDFFDKKELLDGIKNCKEKNSALHIFGLLSDGGVHSHIEHLYGVLELAKRNNLEKVYVHAFLDGRDTAPSSAKGFIADLENEIKKIGVGEIATLSGRFYSMDRDNRWERVEEAYDNIVSSTGNKFKTAEECITESYNEKVFDEFVKPSVILNNRSEGVNLTNDDTVIFFNFRPDRARELARTFCDANFDGFVRKNGFINPKFVCFTEYDASLGNKEIVFKAEKLTNTLGEYVSKLGKKQLRIAETEKYAHVTFFFNGGVEQPYENEDRVLVSSPKVATYDLQPEMSVEEVSDKLVEKINTKEYDLIIANFANPDMVGHTGDFDATVKAIEAVDKAVKKVYDAIKNTDGQMFICADHGNADKLVDYDTKEAFTAHTTNPVPFILVNAKDVTGIRQDGKLSDVAPTLLELMGIEIPVEMTGKSLLVR